MFGVDLASVDLAYVDLAYVDLDAVVSLQWYVTIGGQVSAPWGYTDYAPPSIASFEGTGARYITQPLPSHFAPHHSHICTS